MEIKQKKMILKKIKKFEREFSNAELNVSSITDFIQPYFDKEVTVLMSNDGMVITDDNGEIGFVEDFINNL